MIRNLELTIYKQSEIFDAEKFSIEFSGAIYYFVYKLKKIKIPKCSYIKIRIANQNPLNDFKFTLKSGVLYLSGSHNFNSYILLNRKEKLLYQYKLISNILESIFIKFEIDIHQLDNVLKELNRNNGEMKIEWKLKGLNKNLLPTIVIALDLDNFTFFVKVKEGQNNYFIEIFKSIPLYLIVMFFTTYKIENNIIRIGSKEEAVFEVDIVKKQAKIIKSNKAIESLRFDRN